MGIVENYFASEKVRNQIDEIKAELARRQPSLDWLLEYAASQKIAANFYKERLFNSYDLFDEAISGWEQSGTLSEDEINRLKNLRAASRALGISEGMDIQKTNQAKKGGVSRGEKYQPLKELAATLVNAKNFKSRRSAAKTITPEILAKSLELGIALSEHQAEITITGWLKDMGLPANI